VSPSTPALSTSSEPTTDELGRHLTAEPVGDRRDTAIGWSTGLLDHPEHLPAGFVSPPGDCG